MRIWAFPGKTAVAVAAHDNNHHHAHDVNGNAVVGVDVVVDGDGDVNGRSTFGLAPLALAAFLGLAGIGCSLPTGPTLAYAADAPELADASIDAHGVWESAPWVPPSGMWLSYPPRATIEVEHDLGRVPRAVEVWLSFDSGGAEPALASGDLARVIAADESTLTVRNESNATLYARLVAF